MKPSFMLPALAGLMLLLGTGLAQAEPADAETQERITKSLAVLLPNLAPDSISKTPLDNVYEIVFGPSLVYMTGDGRFLLQGSIIDLESRENITEPRLKEAKMAAVRNVGEDNMLIYSVPEGVEKKHQVTVFTDIDCGYCRKLHSEMDDYHKAGIEIRYLFFPRARKGSPSYDKAVQVWCAEDRLAAMDNAKAGKDVNAPAKCANPVDDHLLLGVRLGVSGTPAIVMENGELLPGYLPAKRLLSELDARMPASN